MLALAAATSDWGTEPASILPRAITTFISAAPGANIESNNIRIGVQGTQVATFIAGISGTSVTGTAVVVNRSGQLGTAPSSQRFKDEIKPMDDVSEAILALKPVTFRYKQELDPNRVPQFGLVAQEVEKVNPALVARDRAACPLSWAVKNFAC